MPPMDGKAVLCTLHQVEKRYARRAAPVLGPLSLTLSQGEVLGIRGANGAGKSTLLSILAGVLRPDAGGIPTGPGGGGQGGLCAPRSSRCTTPSRGWITCGSGGRACGLPRQAISIRSRWLLERLDLTEKGKQPVSAYSGGMQRRLHLASALMITPKVLLLDEPTVGADARSVELILSMWSTCGIWAAPSP